MSRNLFAELRRRNVIRTAGLYAVGVWLIVQVSGTVLPMFDASPWLPRSIVLLLGIGFIPALIFSWVCELRDAKRAFRVQESVTLVLAVLTINASPFHVS